MATQLRRYRVTVDFPEGERDILAALCKKDYRPPDDQLRYLVVTEATRRGLLGTSSPVTEQEKSISGAEGLGNQTDAAEASNP